MFSHTHRTIFRLSFLSPVRFGLGRSAQGLSQSSMTASSDAFFAALCTEWIDLFGDDSLRELIKEVEEDKVAFSGLYPWRQLLQENKGYYSPLKETEYYLPKPYLEGKGERSEDTQIKKQLKKIKWIEASQLSNYLGFLKNEKPDFDAFFTYFASEIVYDRVNTRDQKDPLPYKVSAWQFFNCSEIKPSRNHFLKQPQDTGLYWIVQTESDDILNKIEEVVSSLGLTGIGGKTSSGLGKFDSWREDMNETSSGKAIEKLLGAKEASMQMCLGSIVPATPKDFEILRNKESRYLLYGQKGFSSSFFFVSPDSGLPIKRKTCLFVKEGSCFPERMSGKVLDLSYAQLHPIYRAGKALHVGLEI